MMNSSPTPAAEPAPPVLVKASERDDPTEFVPNLYPSTLAVERGAVCIPSPFADAEFGPRALALGPPISDSPVVGPPLSPSFFWPSYNTRVHNLHCPPQLEYGETNTRAAWAGGKTHTASTNGSVLSHLKLFGKQLDAGDEGLNSSSSAKVDMHFCVVCHDYASGYHYGVWSCEGCKAFFKRSIQGHNDYICPATNQCTIDKNRRKSCQACRLRKCYEVGMMKCGVRRERCGFRGARHRRGPHIQDGTVGVIGVRVHSQRHQQPPILSLSPSGPNGQVSCLSPEQLVHCMLDAEPPQIYLKHQMKKPYTEAGVMMSLTNLADKELVLMISWAKKIPGFLELSLPMQVQMLECCWLEVLMLGLMWRSVDHPGKLIFSPDLKLNRENHLRRRGPDMGMRSSREGRLQKFRGLLIQDEGSCVEGILDILDMLLAGSSRFRELKLQKEEYVCLKALILLNSNITCLELDAQLESRSKLLRLLDVVTDALVWAISRTGLSMQQQSARLAHLLMLLSHIRHLSNKGMEHLSSMKRKNVVLLYDLLLEMLDANITQSSPVSDVQSAKPENTPPVELNSNPACEPSQSPVAQRLTQCVEEKPEQE